MKATGNRKRQRMLKFFQMITRKFIVETQGEAAADWLDALTIVRHLPHWMRPRHRPLHLQVSNKPMIDHGKVNLLGIQIAAVDYEAAVAKIVDAAKAQQPLVSALWLCTE